jgi:hypothetical protein
MMHYLIEISIEPEAADALRTLIMEAGEKFTTFLSGERSGGCRMEGSWVSLDSSTAYLVLDTTSGMPVYELCHEVTRCAPGIKSRVMPVLPIKMLNKRLG